MIAAYVISFMSHLSLKGKVEVHVHRVPAGSCKVLAMHIEVYAGASTGKVFQKRFEVQPERCHLRLEVLWTWSPDHTTSEDQLWSLLLQYEDGGHTGNHRPERTKQMLLLWCGRREVTHVPFNGHLPHRVPGLATNLQVYAFMYWQAPIDNGWAHLLQQGEV